MKLILTFLLLLVPISAYADSNDIQTMDAGLFLLMLILAILCFVLSIKYGTVLLFVTVILSLSLGLILIAQYQVTFTETTSANSETFTTTKCLICNNGVWLGWSLVLFAVLSMVFFMVRTFRGSQ